MEKLNFIIFGIIIFSFLLCSQGATANNVQFNNKSFDLKTVNVSPINEGYENEYYLPGQDSKNMTEMIGIYHYPNVENPIKYADSFDKEIEKQDTVVLLKFIQNKKQNKAVISFLENGNKDGKYYFDYNIYKYEKHPQKGITVLRYVKRYFFKGDSEITKIGHEVKGLNNKLLEQIILSPTPSIIER